MELDNKTSSIDNMGMITGGYSNAGGANINPDTINAGVQAISTLAALRKSPDSNCKKPLFNVGKKKKAYQACLKNSAAQQNQAPQYLPPPSSPPEPVSFFQSPAGMMAIGVLAVVAIGGYFYAFKHKAA